MKIHMTNKYRQNLGPFGEVVDEYNKKVLDEYISPEEQEHLRQEEKRLNEDKENLFGACVLIVMVVFVVLSIYLS